MGSASELEDHLLLAYDPNLTLSQRL
ncbi:hypothetical protein [Moorena sp. SIOASIH]